MRLLYIFPHPDDESFGPAPAMAGQIRAGQEVYLLTLTYGEATKIRQELKLTKEAMGQIRADELKAASRVIGITDLILLDWPDSQLAEEPADQIKADIRRVIEQIKPTVIITYPHHGISGFSDHRICHQLVTEVFQNLSHKEAVGRLAYFTLTADQAARIPKPWGDRINWSQTNDIDCLVSTTAEDLVVMNQALDCYKTYQTVIDKTGIRHTITDQIAFEFFGESLDPPVDSLTAGLKTV